MAGRQTIEAQCRRLNHARNVSEVGSYTAQQFWPAARGSFIISGGSDIKRCKMLSDKLCYEMTYDSLPGFVLTASDELEMEMIQCVQEGKTAGELHVTSRRFPNYLFFQGWESSEIVRFFIKIATLLGYDSGRLPAYMQAFLTILKCYYPLSLSSMLALSEHDDGQIARWGEEAGADSLAIAHIQNYSEEGHLFRSLLGQLKSVFSPLSAEDPNCGYSLANETFNAGELYLINVRSHSQGLVNLYFAEELELALDRCGAGYLVVADLPLREDDKLQELLEEP